MMGENGILEQAKNSSEKTAMASAEEAMEGSITSCQIAYTDENPDNKTFVEWLTTEKLNDELKRSGYYLCESKTDSTEKASDSELAVSETLYFALIDDPSTIYEITLESSSNGNSIVIVETSDEKNAEENNENSADEVDENEVEIEENSNVSDVINAESIKNDAKKYYGSLTSYSVDGSSAKWEILYSNGSNIFLIATDYISIDDCPNSDILKENSTKYEISFSDFGENYSGSSDITLKSLNSSYFNQNYSSEYENMKAVAYMLDVTIWNKFINSKYADYAIGGPTVEMLFNSYNEVYDTNYSAKAVSEYGYQISNDGANYVNEIDNAFEAVEPYVISDNTKASAMWVASPSADATNALVRVSYWGSVGVGYTYYNYPGFRPVVCLSSDVTLELNDDGVYEIK